MNLTALAFSLLVILTLAVVVIVKFAVGGPRTVNSLPIAGIGADVYVPPMPDRAPAIGMPSQAI